MSPFAGVLCHDNPCISRPIPSKKVVLIDFVSTVRGSIPDSVLIFSISTVSCRAKLIFISLTDKLLDTLFPHFALDALTFKVRPPVLNLTLTQELPWLETTAPPTAVH